MAKRVANAQPGDKEFSYNGFVVIVPRSVLKVWEAQADKQLEMIKVLLAHYARLRNKPITEGIRCTLEFGRVPGEPLSKTAEKLANPKVKESVLELLKYQHYRAWHLSPIRNLFTRAVTMAALDGDEAFFKALGERLKKPCKPAFKVSDLNKLLLFNWVGTGICFCWFSDRALLDFLDKTKELTGGTFTPDAIRQALVRLQLPRLRPPLVRSVAKDGKRIFLSTQLLRPPIASSIDGLTITDFLTDETETARDNRKAREQACVGRLKKEKEFFDYAADWEMRERNKRDSQPL
jgi:hypothetical protein